MENLNTREEAQKNLDAAQAEQKEAKEWLAQAQAELRSAAHKVGVMKALVMGADGKVLIARAALAQFGPVKVAASSNRGSCQSEVQAAVRAILLAAAPNGLTLDEIFGKLQAEGVQMSGANPRDNLGAYISRWSKVPEFGVENRDRGVWGATMVAEAPEVPSFLAPTVPTVEDAAAELPAVPVTEVPAFLAPATEEQKTEPREDSLPEGFPGREALIEAGLGTVESLTGKTHDQLRRIKGVGATTAREILEALEA